MVLRRWALGSERRARRPDRFSQKEQNSSVRRQPVRSRWLVGNVAQRPDRFSQKEQN
jgi:hypothetical protein